MLRIDRIVFHGFQSENKTAGVVFSKERSTVIFGDNGCGKTTFLKATHAFLTMRSDTLFQLKVREIECDFTTAEGESHQVRVVVDDDGFNWTDFKNSALMSSRSLSLGIDRGISMQNIKIDEEELSIYLLEKSRMAHFHGISDIPNLSLDSSARIAKDVSRFINQQSSRKIRRRKNPVDSNIQHYNLASIKVDSLEDIMVSEFREARSLAINKIQSALFDTLSDFIEMDQGPIESLDEDYKQELEDFVLKNKAKIIDAIDGGQDNNFKNKIINYIDNFDDESIRNKVMGHGVFLKLLSNIVEELKIERLKINSINFLVDIFNNYLEDEKKLVVNVFESYIEIDNSKHSISALSSGERHLLTILVLVLFQCDKRDLLLIDEPEISLNIRWQRKILELLEILAPETQIIVASHAPAIVQKKKNALSKLEVSRN
jgi:ABC-type cobalamin/Fe3+-siderophores transport system ATPase subunit